MKKLSLFILFAVLVSVGFAQRAPVAINDTAGVAEGGAIFINVLANDSNFNPADTICITAAWGGQAGWDSVAGCSQIFFHPLNPTYSGYDTFYYSSCDIEMPTLCDTGQVIVRVYLRRPIAINDTTYLIQPDSLIINVLANDSNFNPPDSVCLTSLWDVHAAGWNVISGCSNVVVHPLVAGFYGIDTFHYRSCDTHIPALCDTGVAYINVVWPPRAVPDTGSVMQLDTTYINVTANDSDFNILDTACVTTVWGATQGWTDIQGCDSVIYAPLNYNYTGTDTFYYSTCYTIVPILCDTAIIVVNVNLPRPLVDFTYTEVSLCQVSVANTSILTDSIYWTVQYLTGNGINDSLNNVDTFTISATGDSAFQAEVCLTGFNPAGDSTVCYTFWIQCSTGISTVGLSDYKIYPNPASDELTIDLSNVNQAEISGLTAIEVYDMACRKLKTAALTGSGITILVSDLADGLYLIGLSGNGGYRKALGKFEVMR